MKRTLAILALLLAAAPVAADPPPSPPTVTVFDAIGDALARRTDPDGDGALNPNQILPDLRQISLSKWVANNAFVDPFSGHADTEGVHLFRMNMVFTGLVCPPGPLHDPIDENSPFRHGATPLYGFVEINVDAKTPGSNEGRDTGGDLTSQGRDHYLANVARFGSIPVDAITNRVVVRPGQIDEEFLTQPQFERSGAEFVFKLCGCEPLTIVSTSVPGDTTFTAGDTWVVSGKLFERTSAFNGVSLMTCPAQKYTPVVKVQFSHNATTNLTTVSLVYALDPFGAALLANLPFPPPINSVVGCDGNQGCILEALNDILTGVNAAATNHWAGIDWSTRMMVDGWQSHTMLFSFLDPTDWQLTALFGTTYSRTVEEPMSDDAEYVWTDALPNGVRGDVNGDGVANGVDRDAIAGYIAATDNGPMDEDHALNGSIQTPDFAVEFDVADLNYDGRVDCRDLAFYGGDPCCRADWNRDGVISLQDLFDFLRDWFNGQADFNGSGGTSIQDLFDYLVAYFSGC